MYISTNIAQRIKQLAKKRNIPLKVMLEDCGLGKNTLSAMLSEGVFPNSVKIAKIADYLDCSIDYLMGRTDNPEINR